MVASIIKDLLGGVGGVILAICLLPQLWKMWRTQSAEDLSMPFIALYTGGLVLYLAYLLLEKALVGWVTILLELFVAILLMGYKLWLDYWHRVSKSEQDGDEGSVHTVNVSVRSAGSYIDDPNWSLRSGSHFRSSEGSLRRGQRHLDREPAAGRPIVPGSGIVIGGGKEPSMLGKHLWTEENAQSAGGVARAGQWVASLNLKVLNRP